jgi:hypothetical protein
MNLRPIKYGMIIHCRTENEAIELIKWAYKCGYKWSFDKGDENNKFITNFNGYQDRTCYRFDCYDTIHYGGFNGYKNDYSEKIIEYPELTVKGFSLIKEKLLMGWEKFLGLDCKI